MSDPGKLTVRPAGPVGMTWRAVSQPGIVRRIGWQLASLALLWLTIDLAEGALGWRASPHIALFYLVALAPTVPLIWWAWLIVTPVVEKDDEFQRLIRARTTAATMALTLVIVTGWGFLSRYAGVTGPQPATIVLLFLIANIPAQIFASWRYR